MTSKMKIDDWKRIAHKKPSKYKNRRCRDEHGNLFASQHELACYRKLLAIYGYERVIRQVSMPLGMQRIVPDFMVIDSVNDDGTFTARLLDAKGRPTEDWKTKAGRFEQKHGIHIGMLTKDWLK